MTRFLLLAFTNAAALVPCRAVWYVQRCSTLCADGRTLSAALCPNRGLQADADWVRNAVGFVAQNEVELRRIAQLARAETADFARTRFCDGGLLAERAHIMDGLIARWTAQNWLVKEATQRLWEGERVRQLRLCSAPFLTCSSADHHPTTTPLHPTRAV